MEPVSVNVSWRSCPTPWNLQTRCTEVCGDWELESRDPGFVGAEGRGVLLVQKGIGMLQEQGGRGNRRALTDTMPTLQPPYGDRGGNCTVGCWRS